MLTADIAVLHYYEREGTYRRVAHGEWETEQLSENEVVREVATAEAKGTEKHRGLRPYDVIAVAFRSDLVSYYRKTPYGWHVLYTDEVLDMRIVA